MSPAASDQTILSLVLSQAFLSDMFVYSFTHINVYGFVGGQSRIGARIESRTGYQAIIRL